MTPQLALTEQEIERYSGVSGLSEVKLGRNTFGIVNALRVGIAMFGKVPVGTPGLLGTASGLIPSGLTGGVAATTMLGITICSVLSSAIYSFAALGIPVAEAKQIVRDRNLRAGFALGTATALLLYGKPMFKDLVLRSDGVGVAPSYMRGVGKKAHNIGLVLGYSSGVKLTPKEKEQYREVLTQSLIDEAVAGGHKIYMNNWTDREYIYRYARAFANLSK